MEAETELAAVDATHGHRQDLALERGERALLEGVEAAQSCGEQQRRAGVARQRSWNHAELALGLRERIARRGWSIGLVVAGEITEGHAVLLVVVIATIWAKVKQTPQGAALVNVDFRACVTACDV